MSDMKDALRKAGLVSEKKLRQAAHKKRVRRKELGEEGLAAEEQRKEAGLAAEQARRRDADRRREEERRAEKAEEARLAKLTGLFQEGALLPRETGRRRFYFEMPDGRIFFLDVSDTLARRLGQGEAAIVDARGIGQGEFTAVSGKAAGEIQREAPDRILLWNIGR